MGDSDIPIWIWIVLAWCACVLFVWMLPWSAVALGVSIAYVVLKSIKDEQVRDEEMEDALRQHADNVYESTVGGRVRIGTELLDENYRDSLKRMDEIAADAYLHERLLAALSAPASRKQNYDEAPSKPLMGDAAPESSADTP